MNIDSHTLTAHVSPVHTGSSQQGFSLRKPPSILFYVVSINGNAQVKTCVAMEPTSILPDPCQNKGPRLETDQSMTVHIWPHLSPAPVISHWASSILLSPDSCFPLALPLFCARHPFRSSVPILLPTGSQVTQCKTYPRPQDLPSSVFPFSAFKAHLLMACTCPGLTVCSLTPSHLMSTNSNSSSFQPLPAASSLGVTKPASSGTSYFSQVTWSWFLICGCLCFYCC